MKMWRHVTEILVVCAAGITAGVVFYSDELVLLFGMVGILTSYAVVVAVITNGEYDA